MNERNEAIILHSIKYAENSMIVHVYTRQHGKLTFIANGVHSKRSVLKNALLQPLAILDLNFNYIPKKKLQRALDSHISMTFNQIPYDPYRNALAIFIAELLYRTLQEPHTDEQLFLFLQTTIEQLDNKDCPIGNFHIAFLIQYAQVMGFAPQPENFSNGFFFDMQNGIFCSRKNNINPYLEKEDSALLFTLCNCNYNNMSDFSFSKEEKKRITKHLLDYYKLHMDGFSKIKSIDIIYQLFD